MVSLNWKATASVRAACALSRNFWFCGERNRLRRDGRHFLGAKTSIFEDGINVGARTDFPRKPPLQAGVKIPLGVKLKIFAVFSARLKPGPPDDVHECQNGAQASGPASCRA